MAMERDAHEVLLNELLSSELEHSRKTEILQELRIDYDVVLNAAASMTETNAKLQSDNSDLIVSNSKLFRQLGVVGGNDETKKKDDDKNFSETITLESLEK